MPGTFDCPSCGAPVNQPSGYELTVPCHFCGDNVIVPEELRRARPAPPPTPPPVRQFHFQFRPIPVFFPPVTKVSKGWLWLLILVPLLLFSCGILSAIAPLLPRKSTGTRGVDKRGNTGGPARVALKFGSEGTGPGYFKDARSIAVDGEGRIYVGEYTGGRIQVFDPSGKFVSQWSIGDRKTILRGMAADRKGIVYVVSGGNIQRFEGSSGKLLDSLAYTEGRGFEDVTVTADGGLVASWYINRDDIVRFDSSGKKIATFRAAISTASGDSELDTRIATDGLGNIYALGIFNRGVFKFTPEGKFVNRFGSAGNQPGQFSAPPALALDGQGRIYVSDSRGIQVFDSDGRYLDVIKPDGYTHAFGMVFNDRNELFLAARTQVVKLTLNRP
jgi:streptogramin lyase